MAPNTKAGFARLIAVAAILNLATNMVHPVTPTLMEQRGFPDYMFGVMFAAMAVGGFAFAPTWGRYSDRRGRRGPMAASILGYALMQMAFCYTPNPAAVIAIRFGGGSFVICSSVLLVACAVDLSPEPLRARNLAYVAAATTLGGSLGYFSGGLMGMVSVEAAFWAQSALLILSAALAWGLLGETLPAPAVRPQRARGPKSGLRGLLDAPMWLFLLGVTFAVFATTGYDNALNYYFRDQMRFDAWVNGVLRGVAGLMGLSVNLFVNPLVMRKFELRGSLAAVLALGGASVCVMIAMPGLPLFLTMKFTCDIFGAMYPPIQQSAMAENQDRDFGLVSGLFGSARSVGMVAGALAAGLLYEIAPAAPFYAQGVGFIMAAACTLFSRRRPRKLKEDQYAQIGP